MARVLVTGMSGVGKSTLLERLAAVGHHVVDSDYGGWVASDGLWDLDRMSRELRAHDSIVVAGTVENQGALYHLFDHVVLLSAPFEVLHERVTIRTTNPYGRSVRDRAEITENLRLVEPLLRAGASAEFDATRPVEELIDELEALLR